MASTDLQTFDEMLRGLFPRKPEEMPDWARQAWADRAEIERSGRRVAVAPHTDNTEIGCRNVGPATLVHDLIHHDCCYLCNDQGEALERAEHDPGDEDRSEA